MKELFKKIYEKFFVCEKWILAVKIDKNHWKYLDSEPFQWEADPFLVEEGGRYYIFYENMKPGEKGSIFVGELDREKYILKNKREVLKEEFHLSYPNIFKIENRYYMIPETHESGKIILYEAISFPDKWKKFRELGDISCVDLTFFEKEGGYYLFFSVKEEGEHPYCRSLHTYYTENLLEGRLEPLKEKIAARGLEFSRMGGNFVDMDGEKYRFSQDCSRRYGETLNLHRVLNVSREKYEEVFVKKISKPESILGMHTYSASGEVQVIDLCIKNYRILEKIKKGFRNKVFNYTFGR